MAISDKPVFDDEIWISVPPQAAPRARLDAKTEARFSLWGRKPHQPAPRALDRVVDAFRCSGQI